MNRKLLFLCGGGYLPCPTGNGNAVLLFGIIRVLKEMGFLIDITPISVRCTQDKYISDKSYLEEELDIKIIEFKTLLRPMDNSFRRLKTWLRPLFRDTNLNYFHDRKHFSLLLEQVKSNNYSCIYGYDWDAISVFGLIDNINILKVISLVDLIDVSTHARRKLITKDLSIKSFIPIMAYYLSKGKSNVAYKFLRSTDVIIEHAKHHAMQLEASGFKGVFYVPHPLAKRPDMSAPKAKDKIVISIIGSLKGLASQMGFYYFLNELYPAFKSKTKALQVPFEFRIIGYGALPRTLDAELRLIKEVNFVGYVESVERHYEETDIILVNIPISHGFRTRIAEAFSYGKCVVAHKANIEGMPEAIPDYNIVVSDDANVMADKLITLIESASKREQLGKCAYQTFEKQLSLDSAVEKYRAIFKGRH